VQHNKVSGYDHENPSYSSTVEVLADTAHDDCHRHLADS
jgi:hypothetical protein